MGDSVGNSVRSRALAIASLLLTTTGLTVIATGAPASAAPHNATATSVQIGYTDSADPRKAFDWTEQVDMPLGTWADDAGGAHTSRVYATFDLTQFDGAKVSGGLLAITERRAADCSKRAIELWQTRTVRETPTWRSAPRELRKLDEILTPEFCPARITFDVGTALTEAAAAGQDRVTFVLRVPRALEADASYGRHLSWFASVSLTVRYNNVPRIDNRTLRNGGFACRERAPFPTIGGFIGNLQARGTDADDNDGSGLGFEFAVWPVDDPSARTVVTASGSSGFWTTGQVPAEQQVDGKTYAWQVRVGDGLDTSPWSKVCKYIVDSTNPPAPTVTSDNYPPDDTGEWTPLGEPGRFTFSGDGNADVAGFQYGWDMLGVPGCEVQDFGKLVCADPFDGPGTVRANAPGGTATVLLSPPRSGPNTLVVRSLDLGGNVSGTVEYRFLAPFAQPEVTVVGPPPSVGDQVTLRFSPPDGVTGTTSYTYRLDSAEPRTVAAGRDGTATIRFQATNDFGHQLTVTSRSANGWVSGTANWSLSFVPWPHVSSDVYKGFEPTGGVGVPGTFTFAPPTDRTGTLATAYRYTFDGEEPATVQAGTDRRATVTWAPRASGFTSVMVVALLSDGTESQPDFYSFNVA
jgi:hypothetical protein